MKQRNCPNCGAPYDIDKNKCPYCGTSYYDLSALDFTNNEPFYLKIKIEMSGKPCYITQLVRPKANLSLTCENNTATAYGFGGVPLKTFNTGCSITTDISFEAVCDYTNGNKQLMTIQMEE